EAYIYYLRAHEYETRQEEQLRDIQTAVHLYENAIALDPSFALAHARLSLTLVSLYYLFEPIDAHVVKARAGAEEALRLRPNLGEAHMALGNVFYLVDGNYERALKEYAIAARALPNDAEIIAKIAALRRRQGRWKEAIAGMRKAHALDPQNPFPAPDLAF